MTDRPQPVRWRVRIGQTVGTTAACTVAVGGFLGVQAATGNDPALQQIAAREQTDAIRSQAADHAWRQATARAAAAAATPKRIVIIRRVVASPNGGPSSSGRREAPVRSSGVAPVAPPPPPPVVSQGS